MSNFDNMNKFINLYNVTAFTDSDVIATIDIAKSFLYNSSIPIYEKDSIYSFITSFYEITNFIEKTVIETSKTKCFLKGEYKSKFVDYLFSNFSKLVQNDINIKEFDNMIGNGFRPILSEIYEIIRYFQFSIFIKRNPL